MDETNLVWINGEGPMVADIIEVDGDLVEVIEDECAEIHSTDFDLCSECSNPLTDPDAAMCAPCVEALGLDPGDGAEVPDTFDGSSVDCWACSESFVPDDCYITICDTCRFT